MIEIGKLVVGKLYAIKAMHSGAWLIGRYEGTFGERQRKHFQVVGPKVNTVSAEIYYGPMCEESEAEAKEPAPDPNAPWRDIDGGETYVDGAMYQLEGSGCVYNAIFNIEHNHEERRWRIGSASHGDINYYQKIRGPIQ